MDSKKEIIEKGKEFEILLPVLEALYEEVKELSKKKQDGVLNETKVKLINRVLIKVKALLNDYPSIEFLDLLDNEIVPSNSDAVMIITQFKAAMISFKRNNYSSLMGWGHRDSF